MRETGPEPVTIFPAGQGRCPEMRSIATWSQLRAYAQSFSAVEVETHPIHSRVQVAPQPTG
jgi:hypothetical protein